MENILSKKNCHDGNIIYIILQYIPHIFKILKSINSEENPLTIHNIFKD